MTANVRKLFAIALVLMALVSIFVPVASAKSQTWYLCGGTFSSCLDLEKTVPPDGTVEIPNGGNFARWFAGPAQCSLTMGGGTWTLDLDYDAPTDGGTIDISLWRADGDERWDEFFDVDNVALSGGLGTKSVDLDAPSEDFISDEYFGLYIKWVASVSGDLTVNCGSGDSTLKTPSSDPGFPVPEMSSLVLFSVGLLALVGYVAYRKREI